MQQHQEIQLTPQQLLKHAKKHPHTHSLSTETFSIDNRDFLIHNISMKGDPTNDFDIINYRRGVALLEQIVNSKQTDLRVAKKGLRKFYDLMPQYLDIKTSHVSNSKNYANIKTKMFQPLKKQIDHYNIYITQKANGQNAQISWDNQGQFWVIGSKNKTLIINQFKDIKYIANRHQHIRTISIAQQWFNYLQQNKQKIQKLKQILSSNTLIGQICDTQKCGDIVDYGNNVYLYFYAMVSKLQNQYSCQCPSKFIQFTKQMNLQKNCVKFQTIKIQTYQALIIQLKQKLYKINQAPLEQFGQGIVMYITTTLKQNLDQQNCVTICKIKTLQYRMYRKLKQKMKQYFEKYRKTYDKNLSKCIQQIKQLKHGFTLPKSDQYYENICKKAFDFCSNQQKQVSKFVINKFVSFLNILINQNIDKQTFKKIVHLDLSHSQVIKQIKQNTKNFEQNKSQNISKQLKNQSSLIQQKTIQQDTSKRVLIFVPMNIPASGKSTMFKKISETVKSFQIKILSSDTVRLQKMQQMMKKQKTLNKKQAYEKSRQSANKLYYQYMNNILKQMQKSKQNKFAFFLDKNHPQNALKSTLQQINKAGSKCKSLKIKVIVLLPKCKKILMDKSKYFYPFSEQYIICCLKRVMQRVQHQTLQGTVNQRVNIALNFVNMFRNYAISNYNLSKHFNGAIFLPLTPQYKTPINQQIHDLLIKILMGSKPDYY